MTVLVSGNGLCEERDPFYHRIVDHQSLVISHSVEMKKVRKPGSNREDWTRAYAYRIKTLIVRYLERGSGFWKVPVFLGILAHSGEETESIRTC